MRRHSDSNLVQTFRGRTNPSESKLQYLLHLHDYQQRSVLGYQVNSKILAGFIKSLRHTTSRPLTAIDDAQLEKLELLKEDLDYLQGEMTLVHDQISRLQRTIKEQLDLAQIRRTVLIATLVGIFVPMSFLTVR